MEDKVPDLHIWHGSPFDTLLLTVTPHMLIVLPLINPAWCRENPFVGQLWYYGQGRSNVHFPQEWFALSPVLTCMIQPLQVSSPFGIDSMYCPSPNRLVHADKFVRLAARIVAAQSAVWHPLDVFSLRKNIFDQCDPSCHNFYTWRP